MFCFLSLKVLYYFTFRFVALENHEQGAEKSLGYGQLLFRVNSVLPEVKEFSRLMNQSRGADKTGPRGREATSAWQPVSTTEHAAFVNGEEPQTAEG